MLRVCILYIFLYTLDITNAVANLSSFTSFHCRALLNNQATVMKTFHVSHFPINTAFRIYTTSVEIAACERSYVKQNTASSVTAPRTSLSKCLERRKDEVPEMIYSFPIVSTLFPQQYAAGTISRIGMNNL